MEGSAALQLMQEYEFTYTMYRHSIKNWLDDPIRLDEAEIWERTLKKKRAEVFKAMTGEDIEYDLFAGAKIFHPE
jgi:hypothetical protein